MVKSYSFYSYKLNDGKFQYIKDYIIKCVEYKNILSEYISKNLLFDMFCDECSSFDFINKTKHLREKDIHSQIFQQIQKEVYTMYINRIDKIKVRFKQYNSLIPYIKYMIKTYKRNLEEYKLYLCQRFISTNDDFYDKLYDLIERFRSRILNLVIRLQNKILSFKLNFHSLTTPIINNIGSIKKDTFMYENANNIKITNGVIILNLGKKIIIPFKYNKKYHGNLKDYKYCQNNTTKQKQYSCILKIEDNRIRIIATKEEQDHICNFEDVTEDNAIGIDVNLKHNIFALSNGKTIQYNKKFIKQCNDIIEKQAKARQIKDKRNIDNSNGKKLQNLINKQNRRVKAYIDYICNLLIKYCIKHNIKNIVMEDLLIQSKIYGTNSDKIKYKRLIKFLHLNDIKNVLPRISKKHNINVHFVNPEYTSQTCSICGNINKNNRLVQETFCCTNCNHTNNADINSAINIKQRVVNDYLRNNLQLLENQHYIPKFKKHNIHNKQIYQNVYNNYFKSSKIS